MAAFQFINETIRNSSRFSASHVQSSPFIPHRDQVRGFVFDVATGLLHEVKSLGLQALVKEVAFAGEVHGETRGIGCGNHLFIANAASWLHHGFHTGVD